MIVITPEDEDRPGTEEETTVDISDRAELLRYRIACCRDYLRSGAPVAMAIWYLMEIRQAEAELRILAEQTPTAADSEPESES